MSKIHPKNTMDSGLVREYLIIVQDVKDYFLYLHHRQSLIYYSATLINTRNTVKVGIGTTNVVKIGEPGKLGIFLVY